MNQDDSSSHYKSHERTKLDNFSVILKQITESILKLACVIVAVWDYLHTRDIERFVLLLAIGHTASYSLPRLKAFAPKVRTLAKAIAAVLDKMK